jgi:hypothetical protein
MGLNIPIFNEGDPVRLGSCDVFSRIQVVTQPLGGTRISWGLKPGFKAPGPFHFYVDFGRAGTSEWKMVQTTPVVDECTLIDPEQRYYDQTSDFYYRVRLLLPNQNNTAYVSQPQQANGLWSKRDWLVAKEIVRKEYLQQRKGTNKTCVGFVHKRRRWGQPCELCQEYDTREPQSWCETCFSTGFVGGYFKAVDMTMTLTAPTREFKFSDNSGIHNDITRMGRCVAYPHLDTNDVWVRRDNGERYFVNSIKHVAELGGIPLIYEVELRLAPVSEIIYLIPEYGGSSSSSSYSSLSSASIGIDIDGDW